MNYFNDYKAKAERKSADSLLFSQRGVPSEPVNQKDAALASESEKPSDPNQLLLDSQHSSGLSESRRLANSNEPKF